MGVVFPSMIKTIFSPSFVILMWFGNSSSCLHSVALKKLMLTNVDVWFSRQFFKVIEFSWNFNEF